MINWRFDLPLKDGRRGAERKCTATRGAVVGLERHFLEASPASKGQFTNR